jgi:hypothetical protein
LAKQRRTGTGKRSTESARIERLGIAHCHTAVAEMGHIWRDKGVDYGVDGEIELIHEGEVLNRVLWVQSKAHGRGVPFSGESDRGFRYMCAQVDINYWLSGTAPVLLVCSRPEAKEAWFKHLPSWFSDPKRRRDRYVEFDKEADRFDASAARKLLQLGVDASSGLYLSPPPRNEVLTSNLLGVDHVGQYVHVAPTRCTGWSDANPRLIKAGRELVSDVVFHSKSVYSFRRFDEPPLDVLADGPADVIGADELAESDDPQQRQLLTWLLGATLKEITARDLRLHPEGRYLYFKARHERDKKVRVGRGSGRTVVQRYDPPEDANWIGYTRHYALTFQFIYAEGDWYLALVPTYHYTTDGRSDFPFSATQLSNMKRLEGHEAVRSQTTFWARYLAAAPTLFSGPPDARLRFGRLLGADVDRGIDDKSWKLADPDLLLEGEEPIDEEQPNDDLTLFDAEEDI